MKLVKLLSRCLSRRQPRRDRRRKARLNAPAPAAAMADSELERRILLSGATGDSVSDTAANTDTRSSEPQSGSGTVADSADDVRRQLATDAISVGDFGSASARFPPGPFDLNRGPVGVYVSNGNRQPFQDFTGGDDSPRNVNTVLSLSDATSRFAREPTAFNFSLHSINGVLDLGQINSLLPVSKNPLSSIQRSIRAVPLSPESSTPRNEPVRALQDTESPVAEDSSNLALHPDSPLPPASTDVFFSLADSAAWAAGFSDERVVTDVAGQSHREVVGRSQYDSQSTRGFLPGQRRDVSALQNQLSESGTAESASQGDSVFSTADSKTALVQLLNSFVQFDTLESVDADDDDELSDWLRQQLGLSPVDGRSHDVDVGNVTNSFADSNNVAVGEKDIERLQQAFMKIDLSSYPDARITIVSDQPPEPPVVTGIWQRLRFDCNPRGPPVSDRLPGSEFTRQGGSALQLRQLRYSIAPRGPSEASVN